MSLIITREGTALEQFSLKERFMATQGVQERKKIPWKSCSNVLIPPEILRASPSSIDGISPQVERAHRIFGCGLIQEAGILLKCGQVVMATAQGLLQRFYYRRSLKECDAFKVAMTCFFVASKVEEEHPSMFRCFVTFNHLYQLRKGLAQTPLVLGGQKVSRWKDDVINIERILLVELGFGLYNLRSHPHKFILYYVKWLNGSKELAQTSWNYLNDSLRLDVCVRFNAQVIASAAIYFASKTLGEALPENPPWWELFGASKQEIDAVCLLLQTFLYEPPLPRWIEPLSEAGRLELDYPEDVPLVDAPKRDVKEQRPIARDRSGRSRSRERHRQRSRSRERHRQRSRSRERRRRRSRSRERSPRRRRRHSRERRR